MQLTKMFICCCYKVYVEHIRNWMLEYWYFCTHSDRWLQHLQSADSHDGQFQG